MYVDKLESLFRNELNNLIGKARDPVKIGKPKGPEISYAITESESEEGRKREDICWSRPVRCFIFRFCIVSLCVWNPGWITST